MRRLYQEGWIGNVRLKNRIVMAPAIDGFSINGEVSERSLAYFRVRAAGGVGLIIVGNIHVDPTHRHIFPEFHLYEDRFIDKMHELTDVIHEQGAKVFAQLIHQGRYASSKDYVGNAQAVAPSAVLSPLTREVPREMTIEDIKALEDAFAQAARRAVLAGFDGVEICTNSGYLFGQFLSPLTNLRRDEYGGKLEGRAKFLLETVEAVRKQVGNEIAVTVRIGGSDFVRGGNTNKEACEIAALLEKAGADAISVTGGWHESKVPQVTMDVPNGAYRYLGREIRKHVSIPVIMSNRLNVLTAERIIEQKEADFAAFMRPFLADPDFPKKAMAGKYEDIRPCIGCNQGCLDASMSGIAISCLVNAECGREAKLQNKKGQLPSKLKTEKPRNILVVGAGAAGMEFSRVAACRGNKVTIWEEAQKPGGQLLLAGAPPARHDFYLLSDYLYQACLNEGVKFEFDMHADAEKILTEVDKGTFDMVVIATGSRPVDPEIAGVDSLPVVQARDILSGEVHATGDQIVVVGGGAVGIETALFLGEEGTLSAEELKFLTLYQVESPEKLFELLNQGNKKVTIVEMQGRVGSDIGKTTRWIMMGRLKKMGISVFTSTKVVEVTKNGVTVEQENGERRTLEADMVVLAAGSQSRNQLYKQVKQQHDDTFVIGDAVIPGKVLDAIHDAYWKAISF